MCNVYPLSLSFQTACRLGHQGPLDEVISLLGPIDDCVIIDIYFEMKQILRRK